MYDRHGFLLREFLSDQEGRGRWVPVDSMSDRLIASAIVAEDRRFHDHGGIDFLALARAVWQNLRAGAIRSGASTISQQVIRNIHRWPRHPLAKIGEMVYAIRLEHTLSKKEILEQYLNRIPFGNVAFGAEAASQLYFGKSCNDLTWAEATYLMSLPKSPSGYNPYRDPDRARARQKKILDDLLANGELTQIEYDRAIVEPLTLFPKSSPFYAPHFVEMVIRANRGRGELRTTIDLPLQLQTEGIVREQIQQHGEHLVTNASVLIVDNATGEILTMVGSADYFDEEHDGQFNAAFGARQPGSALKPFTYLLAFQNGYTPATIIPDIETHIPSARGTYSPQNYDRKFHGPVRVRQALACSYNIPAVRVVQEVGVSSLLTFLHRFGFMSLDESAEFYGHGLTLGNGEVTLYELVRAYRALANGGLYSNLKSTTAEPDSAKRVVDEAHVYLLTGILSDPVARIPAFGYDSPIALPFACAVKTGTSSDYRDNWTVGYTHDITVGVWVGNFDGSPMRDISGVTGAGSIFRAVMEEMYKDRTPQSFRRPPGIVEKPICIVSGEIPHEGCASVMMENFLSDRVPQTRCRVHDREGRTRWEAVSAEFGQWNRSMTGPAKRKVNPLEELYVRFPVDGAVFKIDPSVRADIQAISFEAEIPPGVSEARWILDGQLHESTRPPFGSRWHLKPGKHTLRVQTGGVSSKSSREIRFEVLP